jgi:hypothetical protein
MRIPHNFTCQGCGAKFVVVPRTQPPADGHDCDHCGRTLPKLIGTAFALYLPADPVISDRRKASQG